MTCWTRDAMLLGQSMRINVNFEGLKFSSDQSSVPSVKVSVRNDCGRHCMTIEVLSCVLEKPQEVFDEQFTWRMNILDCRFLPFSDCELIIKANVCGEVPE